MLHERRAAEVLIFDEFRAAKGDAQANYGSARAKKLCRCEQLCPGILTTMMAPQSEWSSTEI
jgi:hypothetical protein